MQPFLKLSILASFVLALATPASGQSFKAYVKAAEEALEQKDYNAALQHYAAALEFQPENTGIQFQYAEIARRFYAYELAEKYYSKVAESKEGNRFPLANYRLGEVKKNLGHYDEAKAYFQAYLAGQAVEEPYSSRARSELQTCDWAGSFRKQRQRRRLGRLR